MYDLAIENAFETQRFATKRKPWSVDTQKNGNAESKDTESVK